LGSIVADLDGLSNTLSLGSKNLLITGDIAYAELVPQGIIARGF
jgi:hypothetical protein